MTADVRYVRQSATEYTVWGDGATRRLGRVVKLRKHGWQAIATDGRLVGIYSAMSRAGERLAKIGEGN